jgi:rhamnosyltransferase
MGNHVSENPVPKNAVIVAVVVTYQPEPATLFQLLCALVPQVSFTVVVDNGSVLDIDQWLPGQFHDDVVVIPLKENRGVGAAQNIGIAWAKEKGANYVVFSDQDSIPHEEMVKELVLAVERFHMQGEKVACVGPCYSDPRHNNLPPFRRVEGIFLKRLRCGSSSVVPVDHIISSGCLIPIDVIEKVGDMREDLFIDYVDIEWGLRARRFGYQSFGVCAALMTHCLGETPLRFLHRQVAVHSPLRHYYHFRNAILVYKQPWVPLNWKLVHGLRLLMRYGVYTFLAKPRFSHWRMMTLGIWHGLRNKAGKYGAAV